MTESVSRVRRGLMQGGAAVTALGALGFPAISRGQADAIRIGHLTPLTGFLGPLGEYAVMGVKLAVEEINTAGGVMGRKIELLTEDSVNPQTASTKAERLIERGKQKIAVWKEDDGTPHTLSAACTHLGCTVTWNNADRTWDCPCHGSRFRATGEVLAGPAETPMEAVTGD